MGWSLPESGTLTLGSPLGTALREAAANAPESDDLARWKSVFNGCTDMLTILAPELVEQTALRYAEAGADIIVSNTFLANPLTLASFGATEYASRLNSEAVGIARRIADTAAKGIVAGSIGPPCIGSRLCGADDKGMAANAILTQATSLLDAGADMLLLETQTDSTVAAAGIEACMEAMRTTGKRVPVSVEFTIGQSGSLPSGETVSDAFRKAAGSGADSVGINCVFPATRAAATLLAAAESIDLPLSMRPSASSGDLLTEPATAPDMFAEAFVPLLRSGRLRLAGGCCGAGTGHLSLLKKIISRENS